MHSSYFSIEDVWEQHQSGCSKPYFRRHVEEEASLKNPVHHSRHSLFAQHTKKLPNAPRLITYTPPTSYASQKPKISDYRWLKLQNTSQDEQKEFLAKYEKEGRFVDVLVSWSQRNVCPGDHIFYQGSGRLYDHHLLCTKVDGNDIHIIEYTGPSFGLSASLRSVTSLNPLTFGAIKEGILTYKELEKKEAKIRHWPEELERFSVNDVLKRALERKNERDYHAFDNNCEHFVNWCKCGLNTSLQVKPCYKPAWDGVKAVGSASLHGVKRYGVSKGISAFFKGVGNVSDELFGAISSPLSPVGYIAGGLIETGFAAWNISKDYKRMKQGRLSKRQFKINTVATASKGVGHVAGGTVGSIIGSAFGPLGSFLGGAVGYGVGHAVGSAVGFCYEHAPKIKKAIQDKVVAPVKRVVKKCVNAVKTAIKDKVVAPVKKVVNSCVNAVKTAGQTVWKGLKSLFSWW